MKKLKTIDLFSGIGGTSLGLRDFMQVIVYCEKDEACVEILKANMQRGFLDEAPIVRDVTKFPKDLGTVDSLVASFPCTSLSVIGKKDGFEGESGLFLNMMDVIKYYKPAICFFENVEHIQHMTAEWHTILTLMDKNGYDCRWCIISASNAGAHHRRKRWFLLGSRRGTQLKLSIPGAVMLRLDEPWNCNGYRFRRNPDGKAWEPALPRLVKRGNRKLMRMCGNICVPLQALLAFVLLWCHESFFISVREARFGAVMPSSGFCSKGRLYEADHMALSEPRKIDLSFRQEYYKGPANVANLQRHPTLKHEVMRKFFVTPRASNASYYPSSVMTKRSITDLGTELRFEKHTKKSERKFRHANPEWVGWLVGLPRNYLQ